MQRSSSSDTYGTHMKNKAVGECSLTTDIYVGKLAIKRARQPVSVRTRDTLHVNLCLIMEQAPRNQKALVR